MAHESPTTEAGAYRYAQPTIKNIGVADLRDALTLGLADFSAMPTHLVFASLIYPIVGLIAARIAAGYDVLPLVFPLIAGYTLIGPFVATGMYELSRRREQGLDISRWHAFDVLKFRSIRSVGILGLGLAIIYIEWLFVAEAIYHVFFGDTVPESILGFVTQVLTTSQGWGMIILGSGVGFIFAVVVLTLSVVSFPMLIDRDVGVLMAVNTSFRAVVVNPMTMAVWGLIVAAVLLLGALPLFFGLAVALPMLGHATWHLYRKVVEL